MTVSTNHNPFEEKGEPKRYQTKVLLLTNLTTYCYQTEVLLLTSLTTYCYAKLAHA